MAKRLLCILVLQAIAVAQPTMAQRYDDSDTDRFALKLGGYAVQDTRTRVRVDKSGGILGTVLDLEDTLDVDSTADVARLDGYYRFNPRHRLVFSYFKIDRDGTAGLLEDVQFGDELFGAGARVNTDIESEVLKVGYSYSYIHVKQFEFGIGAGLHVTNTEVSMKGTNTSQSEDVDGTAPLPVVSGSGRFDLTPKLRVQAKYDLFFLSTDSYDGTFSDFLLSLEHQTFKNAGFGLGFNRINIDFETDDGEWRGEFESVNNGWLLYLKMGF